MGLQIFEASGIFDPAARGLIAGDTIDVVCVGGGSSGVIRAAGQSADSPSVSGGTSSVGSISSANGTTMGRGGPGTSGEGFRAGCGAGGYLPGVPMYGGNGGSADTPGTGLAGTIEASPSPWCNRSGNGNKGAGGVTAPAGHGYGAGGGGGAQENTTWNYGYGGGDAGKIAIGSITLANTNAIQVTVGAGGVNASTNTLSGAPGVVLIFW